MDGVHYWRSHGHGWPSILRALTQAVFDALASAVVMERDFAPLTCLSLARAAGSDPPT